MNYIDFFGGVLDMAYIQEVERYLQPRDVVPKIEPNSRVSIVRWNRKEELGKMLARGSQISIKVGIWQERCMSYSGRSYQCRKVHSY